MQGATRLLLGASLLKAIVSSSATESVLVLTYSMFTSLFLKALSNFHVDRTHVGAFQSRYCTICILYNLHFFGVFITLVSARSRGFLYSLDSETCCTPRTPSQSHTICDETNKHIRFRKDYGKSGSICGHLQESAGQALHFATQVAPTILWQEVQVWTTTQEGLRQEKQEGGRTFSPGVSESCL